MTRYPKQTSKLWEYDQMLSTTNTAYLSWEPFCPLGLKQALHGTAGRVAFSLSALRGEPFSWATRGIPHLVTSNQSFVPLCASPCHFYLLALDSRLSIAEVTMKQRTLQEKWEKGGGDRKAPRPVLVSACQLDTLTKKDGISIELMLPSVGSVGRSVGHFLG